MEKLKQNYTSPRWSMEIPDCSMPMSMDTYSRCSYNCLYCFSFFQKSHTTKGYLTGQPRSVNPEKVIALFENAAVNNTAAANKTDVQFFKYIQDRRIMQWGGLADEFDEYERRNGVTLELLRYFDKIDYPLSFSTKAAWWTEDSRYMELFARHTHNWHVKISIITADPEKARKIERGVPSPQERLPSRGSQTSASTSRSGSGPSSSDAAKTTPHSSGQQRRRARTALPPNSSAWRAGPTTGSRPDTRR